MTKLAQSNAMHRLPGCYLPYGSFAPLVSVDFNLQAGPQDVRRIWKLAYHSAQARVGIELERAGQLTSIM